MGTLTITRALLAASALLGAAGAAPASAQMAAGGVPSLGAPPVVSGLSCRVACAGLMGARVGSTVRLSGRTLAGATSVVFLGRAGRRDDVRAPVQVAADAAIEVPVPAGARTGPLRVIGATGQISKASTQRLRVGAAPAAPLEAHVDSKRVFLDGVTKPSVSFFVGGDAPTQVRVDLVRDGDPAPVASWTPEPVAAGSVQTIAWDGAIGPVAPPEGRYAFRVTALAGGAVSAMSALRSSGAARAAKVGPAAPVEATTPVESGFLLLDHAFPVQGTHTTGLQPSQVFGAGRSGHTHQGQDVFAACGTPLIAVHSGVIRYRAFQAAAGHYVVLREDDDGTDFAYMHLREPALVAKGARVTTGQLLGFVGDTGDADGCHLHFEQWPAPGWYTGGAPVDPLPALQAWDRTS
jgi:murein DD-endopeptidase MepM/ murein hydrolase activator NlpD